MTKHDIDNLKERWDRFKLNCWLHETECSLGAMSLLLVVVALVVNYE